MGSETDGGSTPHNVLRDRNHPDLVDDDFAETIPDFRDLEELGDDDFKILKDMGFPIEEVSLAELMGAYKLSILLNKSRGIGDLPHIITVDV